jgi:hypothetical protein
MLSEEESIAQKEDAARMAVKTWRHTTRPDPASAISFVNQPPAQGPGEVNFSVRDNGQVEIFYYL